MLKIHYLVIIIVFLILGCKTNKPLLGKQYNIIKDNSVVATVVLYTSDSCIINSHSSKIKAIWNYKRDTIVVKNLYSKDSIHKIAYSITNNNSSEIKISIKPYNLRSLALSRVMFFDSSKQEIASVSSPDSVLSFNSKIRYFVVGIYKARTNFLSYDSDSASNINIVVDYCDDVLNYPYDLSSKLIFKNNQLFQIE